MKKLFPIFIPLFLFSCIANMNNANTLSNTSELSLKWTETNTATHTSGPTNIRVETPSKQNSLPTPDATRPLSLEGPWLILLGNDGLWTVNIDGSGLRKIVAVPTNYLESMELPYATIPFTASPGGKWLAYSFKETNNPTNKEEPALYLISFPDLSSKKITTLYSDKSKEQVDALPSEFGPVPTEEKEYDFDLKSAQIRAAITLEDSLSWSSDGSRLAFSAALDGPSTDVYIFDMASSEIHRVTSGSKTQAVNLSWTPDDKYIIHTATGDLNAGRSGPEFVSNQLWAANPDGLISYLVAERLRSIIRWINNEEFLGYESEMISEYDFNQFTYNLSMINIRTQKENLLLEDAFESADVDPMNRSVVIQPMKPGMYLLKPPSFLPVQVVDTSNQIVKINSPIYWVQQTSEFTGFAGNQLIEISPDGNVSTIKMSSEWKYDVNIWDMVFSPSGKDWILIPNQTERQGIWIYHEGIGIKGITTDQVCKAVWRPDGEAIFFYTEGSFYIAEAPDYQARLIKKGLSLDCSIGPQWLFK